MLEFLQNVLIHKAEDHWRRGPRRRFVGAAAVVGGLAGSCLAGQIMILAGCFRPGVTPNGEILNYWPGFLAGMVVGASLLSRFARILWTIVASDD